MLHDSDKEQIEQLKKFWHEYGRLLMVAIIVGLLVGYGWQFWQKTKHEHHQKAAQLFQQYSLLNTLQKDQTEQQKVLKELTDSYEHSAYASFAMMTNAVGLIQQQHYDEALTSLSWVRKHAHSKHVKDLASVREARLLLELHRAKESLDILLEVQDSVYQPMAYELEGDAYTSLGEKEKAKDSYNKAETAYEKSGASDVLATEKANSPLLIPKK